MCDPSWLFKRNMQYGNVQEFVMLRYKQTVVCTVLYPHTPHCTALDMRHAWIKQTQSLSWKEKIMQCVILVLLGLVLYILYTMNLIKVTSWFGVFYYPWIKWRVLRYSNVYTVIFFLTNIGMYTYSVLVPYICFLSCLDSSTLSITKICSNLLRYNFHDRGFESINQSIGD